MALEFRDVPSINFDPTSRIVQHESATVVFGAVVQSATVMLKGFNIKYTNGDRPVHQVSIEAKADIVKDGNGRNTNTVKVTVSFLIRDSSGNIDDPFDGQV